MDAILEEIEVQRQTFESDIKLQLTEQFSLQQEIQEQFKNRLETTIQKVEDVEDLNNTATNLSPGAGGAPSDDQVNRKAEQALRSIKRVENALDLLRNTTLN